MDLTPRKFYLNDIFDDFMTTKESNMKCDIYEKDGNYHIDMDVPGFEKDEIKIEAKKDYLTISAEKKEEKNDENINYMHRERTYGKYQRSFYLGDLDAVNVQAQFNNGVLKVTIPKKEINDDKRYIEIN